jgi:uncharacterized membrane protein HdeD (DUF308 family)
MNSNVLQSSSTLAIRGALAVLFGIIALLLPGPALFGLVLVFGAYAFIDGVFDLASAIKRRNQGGVGWLVVEGIAGVGAGVITFLYPRITVLALIALFGAWALITGIMKIVMAIRLRKEIQGEWLMVLSGVLSIVVAALVAFEPAAATLALIWTIGIWAIVVGGMLIALSFRVRRWEREGREPLERAA